MTESNKPLNQRTAIERLGHGISYFEEGRFDEAIKAWSEIHHGDDPKAYTLAQLSLGFAYKDQGKLDQAIKTWSNIRREEADPQTYTWAQLNLGTVYYAQNKLDDAITAWSNIHRDDDPKVYAWAQLRLGFTYDSLGKLGEAIAAWSNIRREHSRETYAVAQYSLGNTHKTMDQLDDAIAAWSSIRRDDDPETYAWAQFSIGRAYYFQGKLEQAIVVLSKIRRNNSPKAYARAQLGLGLTYKSLGKPEQAITAWSNVLRHDDDPETYAGAQYSLGVAYKNQGKLDQAIKTWSNINHDDPETYAQAQLGLGFAYEDQGKLDQAIKTWSNIIRDDNPQAYASAQLGLGGIYEDKGKIEQAKKAYRNARDFFYYKGERGYRILECPQEVIEKLRGIAENSDELLKSLQIIPDFESRVAHYSRASTAFTLFGNEKNDKNPSNFRLSTIRGVNDPTEGLVLRDYWEQQNISETIHTNDTATFVSCFTFNHDSLNQFRLYGKENDREATGVSLVFNKEFFSDQSDTLEFIADPSADPSSKLEQIKPNETGKTENYSEKPLIGKFTLYRCIYLDPETGYWALAQRDKSTFYRQYKEKAEKKWKKYYEAISTKEEDIETYLFNKENNDDNPVSKENNKIKSISQILNSIFAEKKKSYNKYDKDEKQKILEAIQFILLPLQYLVKHIAFQEEQECRIMYTTHLHDEKIRHDWEKQWMYVEYEEPVLPHIDKIYLSPGAAKYQDFFRILLDQDGGKSKVRISQNPFRNKE